MINGARREFVEVNVKKVSHDKTLLRVSGSKEVGWSIIDSRCETSIEYLSSFDLIKVVQLG